MTPLRWTVNDVIGGKDDDMGIPARALELELESAIREAHGEPLLGAAYEILRDEWRGGDRDRELALHLLFLSWYLLIEPAHLTGLDEERVSTDELMAVFNLIHLQQSRNIIVDGTLT